MISFVRHNDINKTRWDALILGAPQGNVYCLSDYLDIAFPQWDALILNDYEAVMPLPSKKKFFIHYLYTPFFIQQMGVFSCKTLNINVLQNFINAIPKKFLSIKLNLNEGNFFPELKNTNSHRNIILPLNNSYEVLKSHYHKNLQRNLKKATSEDIELVDLQDVSSIISLFRSTRGRSISHLKDDDYQRFINIINNIQNNANVRVMMRGVKHNATLHAAAVFLLFKNSLTFIFSGQSEEGLSHHFLALLLDDMIHSFAATPTIFDFEGSDNDTLARFYLGFGGEERHYLKLCK